MKALIISTKNTKAIYLQSTWIHKNKILKFSSEGRYNLNEIDEDEVSGNQLNVHRATKTYTAVIDNEVAKSFMKKSNIRSISLIMKHIVLIPL